jgi:hypothetical protein
MRRHPTPRVADAALVGDEDDRAPISGRAPGVTELNGRTDRPRRANEKTAVV